MSTNIELHYYDFGKQTYFSVPAISQQVSYTIKDERSSLYLFKYPHKLARLSSSSAITITPPPTTPPPPSPTPKHH